MNRKFLPGIILAILFSVVYFSCKKSSNNSGNDGRMYFPLQIGKYVTYNVDSTVWLDSCLIKTASYQMRYTIANTFKDTAGRPSYLMDIYIKSAKSTAPWQLQSVVYLTSTPSGLEYVQNQARIIKLIFPVGDGGSWDGNTLIATNDSDFSFYKNWSYTYQNFQKPYNTGYVNFDNTVTVMEVDDSTITHRTYATETYAYNVGLVYREMTYYTVDTSTVLKCKKGSTVIMRAIDHN